MSLFGKNLKKIRSVKKLSQQAFADLFNLKRGTLGAYEEERSEPKLETLIKIANYFSIKIDDLLTKELTVNQLLKFKGELTVNEELVRETFASIPCITAKNESEYIHHYANEIFIKDLPKLKLPIPTASNYRGFTVTNLEMTQNGQGLFPKDVVIAEKIMLENILSIENGTVVIMLTETQMVMRRIYHTTTPYILRADHKNIDDLEISLEEVKEIWKAKHVFCNRLPDLNIDLEDKLAALEKEFFNMKKNL